MRSEGKDLSIAVKPSTARTQVEDGTLQALRRNLGRVVSLPVKMLLIEKNVRKILDTSSEEFEALVDDIKQNGVRQNIAVELHEDENGGYRLVVVFGQRRVLAAREAGLEMIPALIVQPGANAERIFMGLAENIFRMEMHPLDKAEGYQELIDAGWSAQALSEKFERKKRTVQGFLRLARFPQSAKEVISRNPDHFTTHLLFNRFLGKAWKSETDLVEALQRVVESKNGSHQIKRKVASQEANLLAQSATAHTGVSCKASGTAERGSLVLKWQNKEELEKLNRLFQEGKLP
ncbi:MAG TPA: ParB/RepB/Spo0J family partition protein [Blastocatellia bacterium]|nr:ParB/RepB/Spo0J family partition protein [Blastocatellia bacterium]